jgi:hypothetical protein
VDDELLLVLLLSREEDALAAPLDLPQAPKNIHKKFKVRHNSRRCHLISL